jgi:hypothetical protein
VKAPDREGRFAERTVDGVDDTGSPERVVVWIERRPGAVWVVGRSVNDHDHQVWEGYELDDCLEVANATLEDDVSVSEDDGGAAKVRPFLRGELLKPLEQIFFGRR